jgi:voltage-gated potassium channel
VAEPRRHPRLVGFFFTVFLLGLITLATAEVGTSFFVMMVIVVFGAAGTFYYMFPGSNFFAISLSNFLAVYACIFIFFVTTNFFMVRAWAIYVGFLLPIAAFVGGAVLRRESLQYIVQAHRLRDERHLGHTFVWLIPVTLIGALTFWVPAHIGDPATADAVFVGAMAAIAVVVIFASRDVATFLLDSGLLFEEFFQSAARLLVPAFAFLTFYSMLVIVFACIYRILDRFTEAPQFMVNAVPDTISFSQALYFSIITVSTVGYGDVVPRSDPVRVIVAIQIIFGVILLLFGFSEIFAYARERLRDRPHESGGR